MTIEFEEWFKKNVNGVYEEYIKDPDKIMTLNIEGFVNCLEKAYNHYETN